MNTSPVYHCKSCGHESVSVLKRCPKCRFFGYFVQGVGHTAGKVRALADVPVLDVPMISVSPELDEALAGGVVNGGVYLVGGDPGIGKSTLTLQVLSKLCSPEETGLYIAGEEAEKHVRIRQTRCGLNTAGIFILESTDPEAIFKAIEIEKPTWAVLDSISILGGIEEQKQIAKTLYKKAHQIHMGLFITSHVTKDGEVAGPKALEHEVDCRVHFEGERDDRLRILRTPKNRFGETPRMGLFEMTPTGLVDVKDGGAALFAGRTNEPGSVLGIAWEDGRPLMVEIQVLLGGTSDSPSMNVTGIPTKRAALIAAVLERKAGVVPHGRDLYVSIVGGIQFHDPALDLPVALAIQSAIEGKKVKDKIAYCGEIGLLGEVRQGMRFQDRERLAVRMGYELRSATNVRDALQSELVSI